MEDDLESRLAVLCFLDFGGFYDSDGGKVSCWAVTFVPCTGQNYTVAVFFPGTVSKDADAGWFACICALSVRRCVRSVSFLPCTHAHAATDPAVTPVRDLITNVTVLHRQLDTSIPPIPILHGQAKHGDVLFGVKKFIHFEFSLQPGFCFARQFSDHDPTS